MATPPDIETGSLPAGQAFARIGSGSRVVLSIPGLSFTAEPQTPAAIARWWRHWLEPIRRHDLTVVDVGRRPDLPPGSSSIDVADDYAALIRERWGRPVGVMGISTGGGYAQWLASRHPDLVERLVLGFTAHRIPPSVKAEQRRAADHFLAGRWRRGYAILGSWLVADHRRLGRLVGWVAGPWIGGTPTDLRVLRIDADADDGFDASDGIGAIRCPTLVVSGAKDAAYPPEVVRELVARIAGARHIEYPKAGHGGPGAAFAEDACAFLGGAT